MSTTDPDLFAKLMSLPDGERLDLLEFLGATPLGQKQINAMVDGIEHSIKLKSRARATGAN